MIHYPPTAFHFRVDFGLTGAGEADASFQEVSGLQGEVGMEDVGEGGENRFSHRLPTRAKFGNLILKRGVLEDSKIIEWVRRGLEDLQFEPIDITVSLLNADHQPTQSWNFVRAIPVKWSVSNLNAEQNAILIETFELSYNYMRRV